MLINEPIGGDSNDEKSVSLPGSERESRRGFRLVARRIITRNQSSQIVSPVYKVYFDVSQRGYRIGKLEIPIGYWMHTVVHIGSRVAKVRTKKCVCKLISHDRNGAATPSRGFSRWIVAGRSLICNAATLDFLFGLTNATHTLESSDMYIYMRNFVIGRLVYGGNRKVAKEELISLSGRGREERFFWCVENGEFGMLIEIFFLFSDDRVLNYSRLFDKLWLICLRSKGKLNMICSVVNFNCTFFNRLDQIMYFNENCNFNFSHEWK